jgi:hypothetical protein
MKNKASTYTIVAISLIIGSLHFVIGPGYNGILRDFVRGYLMDILLPMNVYLLLQISLRKHTTIKTARILGACITFLIGMTTEVLQYSGVKIFGSTFDPWDIVMYATGIGLGLTIDATIIEHLENRSKATPPGSQTDDQ